MNKGVLTVQEVSKFLRIKPGTVYRLARKRGIPCTKIGGQWRFNRDAIRELVGKSPQ